MSSSLIEPSPGPGWEPSAVDAGSLDVLARASGIPLRAFRVEHVAKRVGRALQRERAGSIAELSLRLRGDAAARTRFRREVAISVTGRFRDPHQYELLRQDVLPELIASGAPLHVWSAGCANGLELVGVATVLDRLGALERSHLLGTDLLEENIAVARASGVEAVDGRSAARMRWEVRDLTSGAAPAARFSLILCRNVAIYLSPDARDRLLRALAEALTSGGVLLLGRSEHLTDPARYGLARRAQNAYRRVS